MVRRRAKAINFGIIYGISLFGLAQQLGIPQAEAGPTSKPISSVIRAFATTWSAPRRLRASAATSLPCLGRRCHVPGINDKNPARRSFMERAAINAPLQGTAAESSSAP